MWNIQELSTTLGKYWILDIKRTRDYLYPPVGFITYAEAAVMVDVLNLRDYGETFTQEEH